MSKTKETERPYTVLTKVPGKPQMLKLAPVFVVGEKPKSRQFPLRGTNQSYPLKK